MTYWVMSLINNRIYMAADSRASSIADTKQIYGSSGMIGMKMYSDGSEKLFHKQYIATDGKPVKIGICTSGLASFTLIDKNRNQYDFTITDILNQFLQKKKDESAIAKTAEGLLDLLKKYLVAYFTNYYLPIYSQDKYLISTIPGAQYILQKTDFGCGLYYRNAASMAAYHSHDQQIYSSLYYCESSFDYRGIMAIGGKHPYLYDCNPYTRQILYNPLKYINIVATADSDLRTNANHFLGSVIQSLACSNPQSIGGHIDFLEIDENGLYLDIGKKHNVATEKKIQPYMHGSDREFISPSVSLIQATLTERDFQETPTITAQPSSTGYASSQSGLFAGKSPKQDNNRYSQTDLRTDMATRTQIDPRYASISTRQNRF